MSALLGHAKAFRALADAFGTESAECGDDQNAFLLARMSAGYGKAADRLEQQMRAEAGADSCGVPGCIRDDADHAGGDMGEGSRSQSFAGDSDYGRGGA